MRSNKRRIESMSSGTYEQHTGNIQIHTGKKVKKKVKKYDSKQRHRAHREQGQLTQESKEREKE